MNSFFQQKIIHLFCISIYNKVIKQYNINDDYVFVLPIGIGYTILKLTSFICRIKS